jgi:hypothetical protein
MTQPQPPVQLDPDHRKKLLQRTLKKIGLLVLAALVAGMSCFGAMDSPDFLEPDIHQPPQEDR